MHRRPSRARRRPPRRGRPACASLLARRRRGPRGTRPPRGPLRRRRRPAVRLSPGPIGLLVAGAVLARRLAARCGAGSQGALHERRHRPAAALADAPWRRWPCPPPSRRLSPYLPQVSCNPVAMPGAVALGDLLRATYPGTSYGIARACGTDGMASEHYEGRAVDWFISRARPGRRGAGGAVLSWLLATDAGGSRLRQRPPARRHVPDLEQQDLGLLPGGGGVAALLDLRRPPREVLRHDLPP